MIHEVLGAAGAPMAEEGELQGLQAGQAAALANGLVPNPHVGPDAHLQQSPATPRQDLGQSHGAGEPDSALLHVTRAWAWHEARAGRLNQLGNGLSQHTGSRRFEVLQLLLL